MFRHTIRGTEKERPVPDQETDINAEILAELKRMNESLSYIRFVAQRFNDLEIRKTKALDDMANLSRGFPRG